ncbi:MAG: 2-phosphosulfolactate phosphatase [Nitriliruptoraceae bacterium]
MMRSRFVDLSEATAGDAVVVIDVLRAFTTVPWALHLGARRILAVTSAEEAWALHDIHVPDALVAGEDAGRIIDGFDLGNSPSELTREVIDGRTIIHRTSAGTQGLSRTAGSRLVLAASFVTASATARALVAAGAQDVTYVITGASHGRDGDEDLACAEFIDAVARGEAPDPAPFVARVATSDAGRMFAPGGADWAPPRDLELACEIDRFDVHLEARADERLGAVEVTCVGGR